MSAASRRRRQWANGHAHLAKLGRPIYRRRNYGSVAEAVQREREYAKRQATIKRKK